MKSLFGWLIKCVLVLHQKSAAAEKVCALNEKRITNKGQLVSYTGCTSLPFVYIVGCRDCIDLSPLENLTTITDASSYGFSLYVQECDTLHDLEPLSKLTGELPGAIHLEGNDLLTSLDGLRNVRGISKRRNSYYDNDSLWIVDNRNLSSVSGLGGITDRGSGEKLGRLHIAQTPKLQDLDGLQHIQNWAMVHIAASGTTAGVTCHDAVCMLSLTDPGVTRSFNSSTTLTSKATTKTKAAPAPAPDDDAEAAATVSKAATASEGSNAAHAAAKVPPAPAPEDDDFVGRTVNAALEPLLAPAPAPDDLVTEFGLDPASGTSHTPRKRAPAPAPAPEDPPAHSEHSTGIEKNKRAPHMRMHIREKADNKDSLEHEDELRV